MKIPVKISLMSGKRLEYSVSCMLEYTESMKASDLSLLAKNELSKFRKDDLGEAVIFEHNGKKQIESNEVIEKYNPYICKITKA
jgi:hypothetical protein